jgi:hypothetical protein
MVMHEPRYSNDEFAKRGNDLYEKRFARKLKAGTKGRS